MATNTSTSPKVTYFRIAIFIFVAIFILVLGISLLSKAKVKNSKSLPQGTFASTIEQRTGKRPDGTEYIYYVVNTRNKSSNNYFECNIDVSAKGSREVYWGFTKEYTESDCKPINNIRLHYECRLNNWINRAFRQNTARTIARINSSGAYEIPVNWFYSGDFDVTPQTRGRESFMTSHKLDEIYSVQVNCKDASGESVSHTQVL